MEVEKVRDLFYKAMQKRADKDYLWSTLDAFDRGDHWSISSKPVWFPKPVTNMINFVKRYKVSSIAVDNLTGVISPLSKKDVEYVSILQGIYDDIWYYTGVKYEIRKALDRCKLLGTGAVFVSYDPNNIRGGRETNTQGTLVVKNLNPNNIYPDPTAFCLEDARYVFIAERKTMSWILSQPKFRDSKSNLKFSRKEVEESMTSNPSNEQGEIYNRDYQSQQSDEIVQFVSYYEKEVDEKGLVHLYVTYYANWIELARDELPYNEFPIVMIYDEESTDDFWGVSSCQQILENQKIANNLESIISLYATMLQMPQKIASKSSGLNIKMLSKYGSAPGMVWETNGDINNSVKNLDTPEVSNSVFNYLAKIQDEMQMITGINNTYMGASVGSLTTSSGVNTLVNRALVLDKDFNIQLEKFIKNLSKLIIETFKSFVDTSSPYYFSIKNIDPNINAKFGFMEVSPEEMQVIAELDYDVQIKTFSNTVDEVQKAKEDAQNLMQMQMQFQFDPPLITPPEYLMLSNISNKQEIIERYNKQSKELQKQRMQQFIMELMQMMTDPNVTSNPEMMQTTLEQLVNYGVEMMNPYASEENKLGSVNESDVQKRQAGVAQPLKQTQGA